MGKSQGSVAFDEWVATLPDKHWAKYDIAACRLGWDACSSRILAVYPNPTEQSEQLWEMKQRACRAHELCNALRLAFPEIPELGDDGTLHEAIHDILRVDTPTAAPAQSAQVDALAIIECELAATAPGGSMEHAANHACLAYVKNAITNAATAETVAQVDVIGHPRGPNEQRDEIELYLRDAYADGCHAAQSRSMVTAMEYAHREAPKLRAIVKPTAEPVAQGEVALPKPVGTQLELIAHCPFCGCEADLRSAPNDYATNGGQIGMPRVDAFFVHCDGCGCDGPVGESEPNARDLWNDRAAQPRAVPADGVVDGMVLVPMEPTPKMLAAVAGMEISVRVAEDDTAEYPVPEDDCAEIYRTMLTAAPSPESDHG